MNNLNPIQDIPEGDQEMNQANFADPAQEKKRIL
jgi:hypothetical protein